MLVPLGDDNRDRRTTPYVTWLFIAINVLVFVFLQGFGGDAEFTYAFSTVPEEIVTGRDVVTQDEVVMDSATGARYRRPGLQPTPIPVYLTIITAMFMHGGLAHILGNMLFLFIFGDNIEDRVGHGRFVVFYLLCGVIASLVHVFATVAADGNMLIPSLGASGAISGVLGAYLLLFPRNRVLVLMFRILMRVPAIVAIGIWFLFQLLNGLGALGSQTGGVAYGAHIGGFISGLALVALFDRGPRGRGTMYRRRRR
ncbi:MAG: rhomboid family intramembrane serine protease [Spirochaetaceae bacterium]